MSKISDLRENEANKINIVKIFELFCGETKYVELFLKLFRNSSTPFITATLLADKTKIDIKKLKTLSDIELEFMYRFYNDSLITKIFPDFKKFMEYNDKNLIENKDLHSYKSFTDIVEEVIIVDEKIALKELEKQITKIYEDDEWLILIPNTYEASVKYGYGTKWCTSSAKTDDQYISYTRDGILIYIIHKGVNKIAVYKKRSDGDVSFWDAKDKKIDSFQANFPHKIMDIIRDALEFTKKYMPPKSEDDLLDFFTLFTPMNPPIPVQPARSSQQQLDEQLFSINSPDYIERVKRIIQKTSR